MNCPNWDTQNGHSRPSSTTSLDRVFCSKSHLKDLRVQDDLLYDALPLATKRCLLYFLYIYIYISTHQTHQPPKGDTGKLIHNPLKSADFFWLDLAKFMWRLSLPLTKQWRLVCLWQVSVHNFLTFIHSCIDSNSQLDFMQQPHSILRYSTRETLTPRT